VDQDAGIGGDAAAVQSQLQAAVEIDPKRPIIRIHPPGVPSSRVLIDDNTLIFIPESAPSYKVFALIREIRVQRA